MSRFVSKLKVTSPFRFRLRLQQLEDRNAPSDAFSCLTGQLGADTFIGSDDSTSTDRVDLGSSTGRFGERTTSLFPMSDDLFTLLSAVKLESVAAKATSDAPSAFSDPFRIVDTISIPSNSANLDSGLSWLGNANAPSSTSLPSATADGTVSVPGTATVNCEPPSSGDGEGGSGPSGNGSNSGGGTSSNVTPAVVSGYSPAVMRHAYGFDNLPAGYDGTGTTIAIVDAYNASTIQSDLTTFNAQFGLTQFNTAGGPTLKVVNQTGGTSLPANNSGWALEIDLDVEWAHAIAPKANIVLVEAKSASFTDLLTAVDYAARNAKVVSMSWGGGESSAEKTYDAHFKVSGVSFVASAGDSGTGAGYPSASPYVISVGGTNLQLDASGNRLSEVAWTSSGGGISSVESEPGYQTAFGITSTGGKRGTPDISYNADPNTGVAVYSGTNGGWTVVGGTSAGAPQVAGLIALVDQQRTALGKAALSTASTSTSPLYSAAASAVYSANYYDITSGSNGKSASVGYDLVTGLGSPVANKIVPWLIAN